MADETPGRRRVPWLASDFNRSLAATGVSFLAYAAIFILTRRGLLVSITAAWAWWACYCFIAAPAIPFAFRRLRGADLRHALLRADEQHSRAVRTLMGRRPWRSLITGGDAPSWSIGISVLNLLVVVFLILLDRVGRGDTAVTLMSVLAITGSWLLLWANYALYYAREDARHGGLDFPGEQERVFSDYLYAALAGNVTFGTTDVAVTSSRMRRTMTGHALVAFVFNTVILAVLLSVLVG